MSLTALMAFALIMSAGIITPGPTVLLSLNNAARFGIKRALWGISGAVVADVLLVALVWLGLGVVLAASETLFVTLSNPKYYIFMTALLPQFVNMTQPALPQYACLATVIVSIDVTVMLSYAALGKKSVRIWKANGIRWMNRISGTFLLILAGSVALYRKSST
ncbi:LysE family translocator [Salmonella enterica]|uniref:LysE family translocator n=1 Tax=Salmonella enterica TaxID=28901 RepID=A0A5T3RIN8_SALER|nr:LysE family translocator [Salmonella enterica]